LVDVGGAVGVVSLSDWLGHRCCCELPEEGELLGRILALTLSLEDGDEFGRFMRSAPSSMACQDPVG